MALNRGGARFGAAAACVLLMLSLPGAVAPTQAAAGTTSARSGTSTSAAKASAATSSSAVTVAVASVNPVAPPATSAATTVTLTLTLTNTGSTPVSQLAIAATREAPITSPDALSDELAHPSRSSSFLSYLPTEPVSGELAPDRSMTVTYTLQTSTVDARGIVCFCQPGGGIYPVDLSLRGAVGSSTATELGWTQTYLPYVPAGSAIRTGWVWPLIDRPHRLTDDAVFTDDDLLASVSSGGRLDRALTVLESVGASAKMTVVIDPELIDELAVMTRGYRVQSGTTTVVGTGGPAATSWLGRLRAVLDRLPAADVSFTPYANPDVDALSRAGLRWSPTMPAAMRTRVDQALGRSYGSTIAWPAGQTVTASALTGLLDGGASTVVLDDATLAGGRDTQPALSAVATLPGHPQARAVVASSALDARADSVLTVGGVGVAGLPGVIAELAMQALDGAGQDTYVVFVPDQQVEAVPALADQVISQTSAQSWASPLSVPTAVRTIAPSSRGGLSEPDTARAQELSPTLLASITACATFAAGFSTAVDHSEATTLFTGFPAAVQRLESSGWRTDPSGVAALVTQLQAKTGALAADVYIVRPTNGTYSLASSEGSLPVTVRNDLPFTVQVRIHIVSTLPGLRTDDPGVQTIAAQNQHTVFVKAHVTRTGHFRIVAALMTPDGHTLGRDQPLSIYSTAIGTIGVVITIAALSVLVLAVLIRLVRRIRRRTRPRPRAAALARV